MTSSWNTAGNNSEVRNNKEKQACESITIWEHPADYTLCWNTILIQTNQMTEMIMETDTNKHISLICAWVNAWVNNRDAGDLGRQPALYDSDVTWASCRVISTINRLLVKGWPQAPHKRSSSDIHFFQHDIIHFYQTTSICLDNNFKWGVTEGFLSQSASKTESVSMWFIRLYMSYRG